VFLLASIAALKKKYCPTISNHESQKCDQWRSLALIAYKLALWKSTYTAEYSPFD